MRTTIKVFLSSIRGRVPNEVENLFAPEDEERVMMDEGNRRDKRKNKRNNKKKNNSKGDF